MDALVEAAWKASVVLALGGVAALAARRASAATRHLIWTAALAGALALPLLSAVLPRMEALPAQVNAVHFADGEVNAVHMPDAELNAVHLRPGQVNAVHFPDAQVNAVHFAPPASTWTSWVDGIRDAPRKWPRAVQLLWATVAMALLLRIAGGDLQLRGIARRATRAVDAEWLDLAREVSRRLG